MARIAWKAQTLRVVCDQFDHGVPFVWAQKSPAFEAGLVVLGCVDPERLFYRLGGLVVVCRGWVLHQTPALGALKRAAENFVNQSGHRNPSAHTLMIEHSNELAPNEGRIMRESWHNREF